ncbi:hypothetical protein [Atopomonas sediminilitoris]|uniref:hypothetical protein n=1 Tax=Atopomonas sediminilitoris TaxID=2919919 RepID=UPI001F4F02E2|nr:hypothetical protein [Atopomonas sediminilitoris]MCJ8169480.1 hypothetical protein [Atopomonas sediminilitoris]
MRPLLSLSTLLLAAALLSACDKPAEELRAPLADAAPKQLWAFIHFNVPSETGMDSYYYYGRIAQPLYRLIKNNRAQRGFITLEEVRYWGNDDKIHAYADRENTGEVVFRIEDIKQIELIANAPQVGLGYEQYREAKPLPTPEDNSREQAGNEPTSSSASSQQNGRFPAKPQTTE